MSSITFDSCDDILVISSSDPGGASNFSSARVRNDSNSSSSDNYTPERSKQLLSKRNPNYRLLNNDSTKALAAWWRAFGFVAVQNENKEFEPIPGLISCLKCYQTFRYGFKSGTKHFIDHANRCFPLVTSNSIADDTNGSKLSQCRLDEMGVQRKVKLTVKDQHQFKDLCAKWVSCDMRPFTIIEDHGFERLVNMLIKIGAQYGLVDTKDLIPSRHTVGRTVNDLANKYRTDLKQELIEPLRAKAVTIAPDFWQNKYSQQSYLGLSITYIDVNNQFKSIDLFCRPFNGSKSYDLILDFLNIQLSEFGISLMDVNIISDRGANFVKAFAKYDPVYCFGHRLNNVLKTCFFQEQKKKKKKTQSANDGVSSEATLALSTASNRDEKNPLSSSSDSNSSDVEEEIQLEIQSTEPSTLVVPRRRKNSSTTQSAQKMSIDNIPPEAKHVLFTLKQVKKLVKYVKLTGMNQEIKDHGGVTLLQATVVRWLSLSNLLESVIKSFKIARKLLVGKDKQELITDLNLQYLKQLCIILKPFKQVMKSVQRGNAPSLYLVPMFYITLKDILQSFEEIKKYIIENIDDTEKNGELFDIAQDDDLEQELPGIKWFRERLLLLLNEMIVLDVRQVAAVLLHPRYRSLKKIPDHMKDQCYNYVRRQIRQLREKAEVEEENRKQLTEPPEKKQKKNKHLFSRFESGNLSEEIVNCTGSGDESDEYEYNLKKGDELDRYLLTDFDKSKKQMEPLDFWKSQSDRFIFLSQYARSILSIPATTTNVEREFSSAGFILNERRTNLQPKKLDDMLLIRSVQKQLYQK